MLAEKLLPVVKSTPAATDPYFYDVTMLLTGDGTNGAQNNTFTDSSSNAFSITRNGNTTQGSFSPYGDLWSNYFDGATSTRLTLSSNTAFAFGTGAYTMECWVFLSAAATYTSTMFDAGNATNAISLGVNANGSVQIGKYGIGNVVVSSAGDVSTGQWAHIAAVRSSTSSNDTKLYVNGVLKATGTDANNWTVTNTPSVGGINLSGYTTNGYISNLRIVKGSAVYTSAFTPSTTPLTAISGTSLLTCQSNRFIDTSSNAFALTVNGTPSVQRFSPFNPTSAYSTSVIGGSGYFDGSGDYLVTPSNAALGLGTGDFTVECWYYHLSRASTDGLIGNGTNLNVYINTSGTLGYFNGSSGQDSSQTVPLNTWGHIAVVRASGTLKIYYNGVQVLSQTQGTNYGTSSWYIGTNSAANNDPCNGYMTDARIVKGTAVYTSAFTPPTAPLTAITNTSLLLNFTNAGIYDNAMMNDLETVGNAQISTSVKKYGTGSIAFDGTGDYLVSNANSSLYAFGTGDYTIEMWVYFNNVSTLGVFYDSRPASTNGFYPTLYVSSGNVYFYFNSANEGSAAVSTGQWYHLAVCRSSGTVKMFLNGTQSATWADTRAYINGSSRPYIGGSGYGSGGDAFTGYIDDLRVTKGYARYTSNFTAPTAALPNY